MGNRWFSLNSAQQKAHLQKVHTQNLCGSLGEIAEGKSTSLPSEASTSSAEPSTLDLIESNSGACTQSLEVTEEASISGSSVEPGLQSRCTVPTHLSVTPASFSSRVNLPQSTVLAIWQKAETLLTSETSIVLAPGTKNSWYVESTSKQVPRLVRVSPKGVISCDKTCEHYHSISICSHVPYFLDQTPRLLLTFPPLRLS